ncbi:hypothetical protein [Streptomyces nigrescens]|uniref:hypothetical protein n=1 Tax=Streptomyces nigrescens TaxID=1920 RepID=UPI0036F7939B
MTSTLTAQLIHRVAQEETATLDDLKTLVNTVVDGQGMLLILKRVATAHNLTHLQKLLSQYATWEKKYWASMC